MGGIRPCLRETVEKMAYLRCSGGRSDRLGYRKTEKNTHSSSLVLAGAKTRELSKILGAFPKIKSALVILPKKDDDILRASANLPGVKIITTDNLNIFDILKYQNVFLTRDVVDYLHKTYGKTVK